MRAFLKLGEQLWGGCVSLTFADGVNLLGDRVERFAGRFGGFGCGQFLVACNGWHIETWVDLRLAERWLKVGYFLMGFRTWTRIYAFSIRLFSLALGTPSFLAFSKRSGSVVIGVRLRALTASTSGIFR